MKHKHGLGTVAISIAPERAADAPSPKRARKRAGPAPKRSKTSESGTRPPGNAGVAAVDRALGILAVFQPADRRLTLAELARRTGLYKSTILRISQSLLRFGYLQCLNDRSYQIGPKPLMLGALYQSSLHLGDVLLPLMHSLAEQTGESVSFYKRHEDIRVCLHRVDSKHAVRAHVGEGDVLPLHLGSGGRILLAFAGTIGEPYERIRREYCYASFGERDPETAGIAVPIFGSGQRLLGSLTLAGTRSRMNEAVIANARELLLRLAADATYALGGDGAHIQNAHASVLVTSTAPRARATAEASRPVV